MGAHILSAAVWEPRALNELIPDWEQKGAPLDTRVTRVMCCSSEAPRKRSKYRACWCPNQCMTMVTTSSRRCVPWFAEHAEAFQVDVFPGFPGAEVIRNETGAVVGVITGDMGVAADGQHEQTF
ncbi:MAG: hypothetical protein OES09_03060 [Gammaproteobacteria bacterium]|nr:hypothetical protein [Gammaproteobacteria bacterium]